MGVITMNLDAQDCIAIARRRAIADMGTCDGAHPTWSHAVAFGPCTNEPDPKVVARIAAAVFWSIVKGREAVTA
jgi:hypothetical protein